MRIVRYCEMLPGLPDEWLDVRWGIMVDHLIRKMSRIQGQGETLVPDGTYVGYSYKNGYWNKIDKIATEIMDTAPRPKPVLDERKGMNLNGDQIKKSK